MRNIAVIGASGSIGSAFATTLSSMHPDVTIHAFSRSGISFVQENIYSYVIDYSDENSIKESALLCSGVIPLDMVIIATGALHQNQVMPERGLEELTKENLHLFYEINTVVPALLAKHFLPQLNNTGRSIFAVLSARIGSISDNKLGGWYSYRASKAALNMIIKTVAIEYTRKNKQAIIVGLHPGAVASELSEPFKKSIPADKIFTPDFSVQNLLKVLDQLDLESTGKCFAWDGEVIEP